MRQVKDSSKIYFIVFFLLGLIGNILIAGFALLYIGKGFSDKQIGVLISISFLGAMLQPIIGLLCDVTGRKRLVLQISLLVLAISVIMMIMFDSFKAFLFLGFLISIVKLSFYGIFDDLTLQYSLRTGASYPVIRSGASYGFGLGIFFLLPLQFIDNIDIVLYTTLVISLLAIFTLSFVKEEVKKGKIKREKTRNYYHDLSSIFLNKSVLLIIFANLIVMSNVALKITYSNILFHEIGLTFIIIATLNFLAAFPEMVILPNFNKVFGRFNFNQMLLIMMILCLLQATLFIFTSNKYIILMFIGIQGVIMAAYPPTIFGTLKNNLHKDVSSTGFLVNVMTQSIGTFLIAYFLITPVVAKYNLHSAFWILGALSLLLLIPYKFFKEEEYE